MKGLTEVHKIHTINKHTGFIKIYINISYRKPIIDLVIDTAASELVILTKMWNSIVSRMLKSPDNLLKLDELNDSIIIIHYILCLNSRAKKRKGYKRYNEYRHRDDEYKLKKAFDIYKKNPKKFLINYSEQFFTKCSRFKFKKLCIH